MPDVAVFGSLHYDILVDTPLQPRKSETVAGLSWSPKCGGKGGNQAVAAAKAGASVAMIGAVGQDPFGEALIANLDRAGVDRRAVRIEPGAATGMSVAIRDEEGDYSAIIVSGVNRTLSEQDVASARHLLRSGSWLVLQNEVPEEANLAAASEMAARGGHVLLNAAPARPLSPRLAAAVDILVVNAIEAQMLADGAPVENLEGALTAARILAKTCRYAIVTAGGAGVACAGPKGEEITVEAVKVEVKSTHGAGDAFIGQLAASLAQGEAIADAIAKANRTAALLVGTPEAERVDMS